MTDRLLSLLSVKTTTSSAADSILIAAYLDDPRRIDWHIKDAEAKLTEALQQVRAIRAKHCAPEAAE